MHLQCRHDPDRD
jgi:hypothetical protein